MSTITVWVSSRYNGDPKFQIDWLKENVGNKVNDSTDLIDTRGWQIMRTSYQTEFYIRFSNLEDYSYHNLRWG